MISRENAEHYRWGDECDGWHLVRTAEMSVIEERMPSGASEVKHRHVRSRQFFRVLRGMLTMELGDVQHDLSAGEGIEVAPGVAHVARNDSNEAVEFLVVSVPPSHGDREVVEPGKGGELFGSG